MATPEDFEAYFGRRAELAEQLYRDGWREEAYLIATAALDAVATIWRHDIACGNAPEEKMEDSPPLRLNLLLDRFAPMDAEAPKVAVVLFAEDMQRLRPDLSAVAGRLLRSRVEHDDLPEVMQFRASPKWYLDCGVHALAIEAPELDPKTLRLAEHYRYPAFAYRFLRSSTAHAALRGSRVNRFSGIEPTPDVDYFPEWTDRKRVRPISLGIGLGVVTNWIRMVVANYVKHCPRPADEFDPSRDAQERLDRLWRRPK